LNIRKREVSPFKEQRNGLSSKAHLAGISLLQFDFRKLYKLNIDLSALFSVNNDPSYHYLLLN